MQSEDRVLAASLAMIETKRDTPSTVATGMVALQSYENRHLER